MQCFPKCAHLDAPTSTLVTSSQFTVACDKMKRHEIILNSQLSCFVDISLVPGPARSWAPPSRPPIDSRTLRPPRTAQAPIGSRPPSERLIFRIVSESAIPADSPVGVYIVTFDRDATHISDSYLNRLRPVRPPPVASSHFTFACDRMKRHEINSQLTVVVFRRHQPRPGARAVPGASISATHRFPPIGFRTLRPT